MIQRIKKDWENYKVGLVLAAVYLVVSTIVLGEACPSMIFLGKPCPGCGLTRAFFYFITFRWQQAWQMNAMIFPLMLFLLWCIFFHYIKGKKIPGFYIGIALLCIGTVVYFFIHGKFL